VNQLRPVSPVDVLKKNEAEAFNQARKDPKPYAN
jgi:hypothetical protein